MTKKPINSAMDLDSAWSINAPFVVDEPVNVSGVVLRHHEHIEILNQALRDCCSDLFSEKTNEEVSVIVQKYVGNAARKLGLIW